MARRSINALATRTTVRCNAMDTGIIRGKVDLIKKEAVGSFDAN